MNTSKLKKFAQATRRKLIGLVSTRLDYVLKTDSAELRGMEKQVDDVKKLIKELGREELIEKVAYTWFNRFMALRFMDVNDYHTFRVRVVSPVEGHSQPEILEQAKSGSVDEELRLDRGALDQEISAGEDNKALRRLIVAVCNRYFDLMPFMFEKVSDYTELLMPEDLLSESSVVAETVEAMGVEECRDVEVIGWLYQFYISEKKDEVFAALKNNVKITPQNIPAATQLFTPHWIVRYMVENSLGRLWLLNRPNSGLKQHMKYFVETEPEKEFLKVESVEAIKLCDPACGSGHILVYAFDLLTKIYEEEGYDSGEIPRLILEKNLYGIDIDDRAAALASFALVMKGRGYYRRLFRKGVTPNVMAMQNVVFEEKLFDLYQQEIGKDLISSEAKETLFQFEQAKNFGSLIKPTMSDVSGLRAKLAEVKLEHYSPVFEIHQKVIQALEMVEYLTPRYHCVVANPPYMGGKGMNGVLGEFVKENYKDTKGDLFACCIERFRDLVQERAYFAMVTMQSWMFLSSYEEFRKRLLEENHLVTMGHFGNMVMGIAFGTCAFSCCKQKPSDDAKGLYFKREVEDLDDNRQLKEIGEDRFYRVNQKDFTKIPGEPVAYWLPNSVTDAFLKYDNFDNLAEPKSGLSTTDNSRFLRFWWEVSLTDVEFKCQNTVDATSKKWYPICKGGAYRKWYGNNEYIVNWKQNGKDIKEATKGAAGGRVVSPEFYFKEGITWSGISSGKPSMRLMQNAIFGSGGKAVFTRNTYMHLAILNSDFALLCLGALSPTLNYEAGHIGKIPCLNTESHVISNLVQKLIVISKNDWDSLETSSGFSILDIIHDNRTNLLYDAIRLFIESWQSQINTFRSHELQLNSLINELFAVKNAPRCESEDITLEHFNVLFKNKDHYTCLFSIIISYSIGCILGRYSLDKPGLILANQGDTLKDFLAQIPNPTFLPDEDNIIPIVDGDYFSDDIVSRFKTFLKVSFGEEHYQENLKFIEEALGKDLRKYFLKDFYPDHLKRYKKRPIYWMFSSPKGSFNCLIYMHRYRSDTVSRIVSNYLQEFIHKLNSQIQTLSDIKTSANSSASAQTKATKEIDKIKKMLKELQDYERDIMIPLAQQKIEIDLDDGVKQNYPKFGKALYKIPGLESNDD